MMKGKSIFREILHLSIPLAFVEFSYQQETRKQLPWSKENFDIYPYLIYERKEGQVYAYMDDLGIQWQEEHAGTFAKGDSFVSSKIREYYNPIRDVIEEERILSLQELRDFLSAVEDVYPWLNYLWWGISYREDNNISFEKLLQLRKDTEYFIPGFVAVLRKSLLSYYSDLDDFIDAVLLSEFFDENIPLQNILEKRKRGYVFTDNRLFNSLDEVLHDFPHIEIVEEKREEAQMFTGQTAYPGKIVGKVKHIQKRDDIHDFEEGDVLVASTTTPDYLPAIKKAGAIISEHGGALSHASIVSRELHIPCIVGVKHITKYVKDGDLVEVDADNGVVKILERAKEENDNLM